MDEQKRTNRKGIIILIVVLLLLAAMAFGIWMLLRGGDNFNPSLGGTTGTTDTTQGTTNTTQGTTGSTESTGSTGATDSNKETTGPNTDTTVPGDDTTPTNPGDQTKPSNPGNGTTPTNPGGNTKPSQPDMENCSHNYAVTTVEATCDKDGEASYACTLCGHTYTKNIPATGHKYGKWETKKAATCDSDGLQVSSCIVCGNAQQETIKATGHSYGSWKTTKQPTCDTNGTKERTCSKCKHAQQETIAATGHTWDNGKVTKVPNSCEDVGIKTYTCSTCGKTRVEQMKGNHTWGEWQWESYTYLKNGIGPEYPSHRKYRLCTACGYREDVNTPDHNCKWKSVNHTESIADPGSCVSPKIIKTTCNICGWFDTKEDGYGSHTWSIEKRHISDYTETTNELDVTIGTCTLCQKVTYEWKYGEGWLKDNKCVVDIGFTCSSDIYGHTVEDYLEHPTWQTVQRNIVRDSSGKITQYTQYWYDHNGTRHSMVIDVLAIPDIFRARGYDIEYYESKGLVRYHFTIVKRNGEWVIDPVRISWVAIGG